MSQFLHILEVVVVAGLMFGVLVAAHEYGHYLFAKLFKMGVEEFAIGMGKKVKTLARKTAPLEPGSDIEQTTEYNLRLIPFGGFVRIVGMEPKEDGSEAYVPGGFYSKSPWKRFLTLLAGPLFSLIAGVALLIPVYAIYGIRKNTNEPVIASVKVDGPAGKAGVKPDDRVLEVNGQPISKFSEMVKVVSVSTGKTVHLKLQRADKTLEVDVVPEAVEGMIFDENMQDTGETGTLGRISISPQQAEVPMPFGAAIVEAVRTPWAALTGVVKMLRTPKDFENNVGGPGTIVKAVSVTTQEGYRYVFWLAAMLSISLGIMNLLPVPPLDGGQMVVAIAEMLRGGRRLSFRVQNWVFGTGFVILGCFIAAVLFVDVKRIRQSNEDPPKPAATQTAEPSK